MSYPYEISIRDKSAVLYDFCAIDTATDVIISFDYVCTGISTIGNHGFSLFFTENIGDPVGGGPGPGLGVTALTAITAGMTKYFSGVKDCVLAIGFDVSGLFGASEVGLDSDPNIIQNSIAIRGGKAQDFQLLYKTPALTATTFEESFTLYRDTLSSSKTFRVRITNGGKTVILDHKRNKTFYNIFTYNLPYQLPKCIYPSIGCSSGDNPITLKISNFHENGIFLSPTPRPTVTPTPTLTPTITPTITPTPSKTPAPTITPSITLSITPSITVSPSITPSVTITPSPTPTPIPCYISGQTTGVGPEQINVDDFVSTYDIPTVFDNISYSYTSSNPLRSHFYFVNYEDIIQNYPGIQREHYNTNCLPCNAYDSVVGVLSGSPIMRDFETHLIVERSANTYKIGFGLINKEAPACDQTFAYIVQCWDNVIYNYGQYSFTNDPDQNGYIPLSNADMYLDTDINQTLDDFTSIKLIIRKQNTTVSVSAISPLNNTLYRSYTINQCGLKYYAGYPFIMLGPNTILRGLSTFSLL